MECDARIRITGLLTERLTGLVRWSGAGSVRNLAFLDLIVKKSMSLLLGLPNTQPNAQTGSSPRQEIHQGFSGIV